MFQITPLDKTPEPTSVIHRLKIIVVRLGSLLEIILILSFWWLIFSQQESFAGFTLKEIVTYILVGNIIGFTASFLWSRIIAKDLKSTDSKMIIYKPLRYFCYILTHALSRCLVPLIISVGLNLLLLQILIGSFPVNLNIPTLSVMLIIIILAFFTEFMIAYLINLYIFWTIESVDVYRVILRFKKLLSGAYFPLTILPLAFSQIILLLPFAYSFYVPTQLYLGKVSLAQGIAGIFIQLFWIIVLYIIIKFAWSRKRAKINKQTRL